MGAAGTDEQHSQRSVSATGWLRRGIHPPEPRKHSVGIRLLGGAPPTCHVDGAQLPFDWLARCRSVTCSNICSPVHSAPQGKRRVLPVSHSMTLFSISDNIM